MRDYCCDSDTADHDNGDKDDINELPIYHIFQVIFKVDDNDDNGNANNIEDELHCPSFSSSQSMPLPFPSAYLLTLTLLLAQKV